MVGHKYVLWIEQMREIHLNTGTFAIWKATMSNHFGFWCKDEGKKTWTSITLWNTENAQRDENIFPYWFRCYRVPNFSYQFYFSVCVFFFVSFWNCVVSISSKNNIRATVCFHATSTAIIIKSSSVVHFSERDRPTTISSSCKKYISK